MRIPVILIHTKPERLKQADIKYAVIPCTDGKLTADLIRPVLKQHENEHWVEPSLVYISLQPNLEPYTQKKNLKLYQFCKRHNLYLYIDGARLAWHLP